MSLFNLSVFNVIYHFAHRSAVLDFLGIFLAQYLAYFLVLAFLVLVVYQKGLHKKIYLFCEGVLAIILARGIIANIIYFFYYHPRPIALLGISPLINESGTSFPSGHMTWFFALGVAVWYADRKWGTWFLSLSLLMGIARIYVGVHWPLDILGGIVIGLASGMFVHWLLFRSVIPSQEGIQEKI